MKLVMFLLGVLFGLLLAVGVAVIVIIKEVKDEEADIDY